MLAAASGAASAAGDDGVGVWLGVGVGVGVGGFIAAAILAGTRIRSTSLPSPSLLR